VVKIAATIAAGARAAIASPPLLSMMAMSAGLIFLCLWQGWTRPSALSPSWPASASPISAKSPTS
jgi:hypothetical protein